MPSIACDCGAVRFDIVDRPVMSVICHCTSCRTAGQGFDAHSPVAPIVDAAGGTPVLVWRKDRIRCVQGSDRLEAHRLKPDSPSRRLVAACCGTPIMGDFTKGFWASIYRDRVPDAPPPTMRVMTDDAPDGTDFPDDGLPRFRRWPARFLVRLLATWATMGFRKVRMAGIAD